jgi:hypothetical protein
VIKLTKQEQGNENGKIEGCIKNISEKIEDRRIGEIETKTK